MPPNIVFVIADQHRWDFLGCADGRPLTPELDRLAVGLPAHPWVLGRSLPAQPLPNLDRGEYHPL